MQRRSPPCARRPRRIRWSRRCRLDELAATAVESPAVLVIGAVAALALTSSRPLDQVALRASPR